MMSSLFAICISFYITLVLVPPLRRIARRISLVDQPDERKIHVAAIPRVRGVGIIAGALATFSLWVWAVHYPFTPQLKGLLIGIIILSVTGILDDFFNLHYKKKLFGQCLAVALTLFFTRDYIVYLGVWSDTGEMVLSPFAGVALTFVFIAGITNAINLSDGLDGLAGGLSIFIFTALAIISFLDGRMELLIACFAVIGALLAFLRYNSFPANVFMGDTGSLFLGFTAAVISIALTQNKDSAIARMLPLLILGLPVMDMVFVFFLRLSRGMSPFKPDRKHFHYQFMRIGFSHAYAVVWMYFLQSLLFLLSINLRYSAEIWVLGAFTAIFGSVLLFFYIAWRFHLTFSGGPKKVAARLNFNAKPYYRWVKSLSFNYVYVMVPVGLLGFSFTAENIDMSFTGAVALLSITSLILVRINRSLFSYSVRLTLYIFCLVLMLYTQHITLPIVHFSIQTVHHLFWASIALAVVVYHLVTRFEALKDTTLDYIILYMVLGVVLFPSELIARWHLMTVTGGMLVFLWGSHLIWNTKKNPWNLLNASGLAGTVVILVRGLS